jgi:hypothetical protein
MLRDAGGQTGQAKLQYPINLGEENSKQTDESKNQNEENSVK